MSKPGKGRYGNYSNHGVEYGKGKDGSIISQSGRGDKGSIHATNSGHTTMHSDGNNHHHGSHASKGAFSKEGVYSSKRK